MKILYNFATRSRREKYFKVLDNIQSLSKRKDYNIIVSADEDDKEMYNIEVFERTSQYKNVRLLFGSSTGKINAINRSIPYFKDYEYDIIINISDDQLFAVDGFDEIIIADMKRLYPDTDGFLHYPDQSAAGLALATMSIIGRKYFERFGYIYHESYRSVYCDNESIDVAKKLAKHSFINKEIYCHYHPVWKKSEWDEQYRKTEDPAVYLADQKNYLNRKRLNFPA